VSSRPYGSLCVLGVSGGRPARVHHPRRSRPEELAPALRVWHEAILEFLAATAVPAAAQFTPEHSEMIGYPASAELRFDGHHHASV